MRYTNHTDSEIKKITVILDKSNVSYEVVVNGESTEGEDQESKAKLRHGAVLRTSAFYDIIIEAQEFTKLSPESLKNLERLNIFPDMSAEIEFDDSTPKTKAVTPVKKFKFEQLLGYAGFAMLVFALIQWFKKYVINP